ncbi:four helix bundle protein [bacterium]|nr:four helix bundle protein [bacterium]HNW15800.1 four helix bundle protein [bacterium]
MSRYENLFIYRKSMELTVFIEQIVAHFSQYHKYTIGSKLRDLTYSTTVMIIKINNRPKAERKELLHDLRETIEEIKVCLNIAKELKAFNNINSYFHASKLAVDISRQSEGWLKHTFAPES